MARIRTIKPDMGESKDIAKVSFAARYFFALLLCHLDDEGRMEWLPRKLAGMMFAHEDIETSQMLRWLEECEAATLLKRYEIDGILYIWSPTFKKHQTINRPVKSRIPPPPADEDSVGTHGVCSEDSHEEQCQEKEKEKERERERERENARADGHEESPEQAQASGDDWSIPWWERPPRPDASRCKQKSRQVAALLASTKLKNGSRPFGPDQIPEHETEQLVASLLQIDPGFDDALAMVDTFAGTHHDQERVKSDRPLSVIRATWLPRLRYDMARNGRSATQENGSRADMALEDEAAKIRAAQLNPPPLPPKPTKTAVNVLQDDDCIVVKDQAYIEAQKARLRESHG